MIRDEDGDGGDEGRPLMMDIDIWCRFNVIILQYKIYNKKNTISYTVS